MQNCSICHAPNANRNAFCGNCGEPILDPGFEKKFQMLLRKERRRNWIKFVTASALLATLLGWVEYESNTRLIAAAVRKAAPVVEAQLESAVEKNVRDNLPTVAADASRQVAIRIRQEFEDGYMRAAREEAQKITPDFEKRLAAIRAEEEAKLRAAYQQAQANAQPASSCTSVTPTIPLTGTPSTLVGAGMPTHSQIDDIIKWANSGSTSLTYSVTSTQLQNNSGPTFCFTDTGKPGSRDPKDGTCKDYTIQAPFGNPTSLVSTAQ